MHIFTFLHSLSKSWRSLLMGQAIGPRFQSWDVGMGVRDPDPARPVPGAGVASAGGGRQGRRLSDTIATSGGSAVGSPARRPEPVSWTRPPWPAQCRAALRSEDEREASRGRELRGGRRQSEPRPRNQPDRSPAGPWGAEIETSRWPRV